MAGEPSPIASTSQALPIASASSSSSSRFLPSVLRQLSRSPTESKSGSLSRSTSPTIVTDAGAPFLALHTTTSAASDSGGPSDGEPSSSQLPRSSGSFDEPRDQFVQPSRPATAPGPSSSSTRDPSPPTTPATTTTFAPSRFSSSALSRTNSAPNNTFVTSSSSSSSIASSTRAPNPSSLQHARTSLHRTSLPVRSSRPPIAPIPLRPTTQTPATTPLHSAPPLIPAPAPLSPPPFLHQTPTSPPPPPPHNALQSHLFETGLLQGALSDVHLLCFGHVYRLHSIVLAQSVFFTNLLSGGFSEERAGPRKFGEDNELIEIGLREPMTRAAFEFSIARMYGGGPALVPPPWARATPLSPLSPAFERLWSKAAGKSPSRDAPPSTSPTTPTEDWLVLLSEGVQPATPTFLISLLATATYLEIPFVQQEVFKVLQSTITPWTVSRYLSFALGHGLGPSAYPTELDSPCRGLESVGTAYSTARSRTSTNNSTTSFLSSAASASSSSFDDPNATVFVGPEGTRVGEAVAMWLAKWGTDVFLVEEWLAASGTSRSPNDDDALPSLPVHLTTPDLRVWSSLPGGLSPSWMRSIISSDAFFLEPPIPRDNPPSLRHHQEFDRYSFAKRVVEFRRRELATREREGRGKESWGEEESYGESSEEEGGGGEGRKCSKEEKGREEGRDDEEEKEVRELFANGILYSHLTFDQLCLIRNDVSPTTGHPYVPDRVITSAFFSAQELKLKIPSTSSSSLTSHALYETPRDNHNNPTNDSRAGSPSTLPTESTHLNLAARVNPLLDPLKLVDNSQRFFLVPVDNTCRINDGAEPSSSGSGSKKGPAVASGPENFFGLAMETRMGVGGRRPGVFGSPGEELSLRQFVPLEPFRISLQFWNVAGLQDKQRIYSNSFFYLGSAYNCYLQRLNKRGLQLGIYLHRQNHLEPLPDPSRAGGPGSSPFGSPSLLSPSPPSKVTPVPYVDKRKQIQVFFSLWCPNQLGVSVTRFSSGPDSFAVSQSWGWKSSSLRSEEYLGSASLDLPTTPGGTQEANRFSSLRVTLVMGVV